MTVNEMSERKSTSREKLKVANQEEWIQKLKEHFKNILRNLVEVTDKPFKELLKANMALN